MPAFVLGIVDGVEFLDFAFGIIGDDHLDRAQHGEPAQGAFVQVFANGIFQHGHVGEAVVFGDADVVGEFAEGLSRTPRRRMPLMVGIRGRPSRSRVFVDELHEFALGHDGVGEDEAREFVLMRQGRGRLRFSRIQS